MKKLFSIIIILAVLAGAGVYLRADFENAYRDLTGKYQELKDIALGTVEEEAQKEVSAPPPLRSEEEAAVSNLTRAGTIEWTNVERSKNNRRALSENKKLNQAAETKLRDMFQRQYFDHISPAGKGPADLAEDADYEYIAVGENLALGNFADDRALVAAWMASPGHRENILNTGFSEIGVAVGKGNFEGKTVWLAVQEFGRPESACPKADAGLKKRVEANTKNIETLGEDLSARKKRLKQIENYDDTEAKIEEYNELVGRYNVLVEQTKDLIAEYNRQVKKYNACVAG